MADNEEKTDTEKYAMMLLGAWDENSVIIISEIRPDSEHRIAGGLIWKIDEGKESAQQISTRKERAYPGKHVIYMPAVSTTRAYDLARAEFKRNPEKYPNAVIL